MQQLLQSDAHAAIPAQERSALIDLYNSTNGANWTDKTNWLGAPGTECTWYGITCDAGSTNVTFINMGNNNLSGSIPSSLGNLTNLQGLALTSTPLNGSIPTQLGNLTHLGVLYLSSNQLSGDIPSSLSNLTNLYDLHLN